ncbi:unnamed protein product [Prorocentrum cordatum]|uniref:ABC transporter domain-containing protein n=1 Tax=Prorocentrum cordatum TaxID=2364126 RepID=A0ABN9XF58_9DINO|nr:unnamed protein product [Polarella glacialis]
MQCEVCDRVLGSAGCPLPPACAAAASCACWPREITGRLRRGARGGSIDEGTDAEGTAAPDDDFDLLTELASELGGDDSPAPDDGDEPPGIEELCVEMDGDRCRYGGMSIRLAIYLVSVACARVPDSLRLTVGVGGSAPSRRRHLRGRFGSKSVARAAGAGAPRGPCAASAAIEAADAMPASSPTGRRVGRWPPELCAAVHAGIGTWQGKAQRGDMLTELRPDGAWRCLACAVKEFNGDRRGRLARRMQATNIWAQALLRGFKRPAQCDGAFPRVSAPIIRRGPGKGLSLPKKKKGALTAFPGGRLDRDIELLFGADGETGCILRCDEKRYHRASAQFLCADAYSLDLVAMLLRPTTKSAGERVLSALGEEAVYRRYLLPSGRDVLHAMAEDMLRHPIMQRMRVICRRTADETAIGIDGQCSVLLSVLYQQKHGQRSGAISDSFVLHLQLSAQCPGVARVLRPVARGRLPRVLCVAEGPLHVALKVESAAGERVIGSVPPGRERTVLRRISGDAYSDRPCPGAPHFLEDVAASCVERPGDLPRKTSGGPAVRASPAFATSPRRVEHLFDSSLFAAGRPEVDVPSGAARDEVATACASVKLPAGWMQRIPNLADARPEEREVLITGPSGAGKSTLFRALSGAWPWAEGGAAAQGGLAGVKVFPTEVLVLPGQLREAVAYPLPLDGDKADKDIAEAIRIAGLGHLLEDDGLDCEKDWGLALSAGQKARLSLARLIFQKDRAWPRWTSRWRTWTCPPAPRC